VQRVGERVLDDVDLMLHNDLRADPRLAMRLILQARGVLPGQPARPTPVQVVTPDNLAA
jgi:LacI family transcriptional regulator